MSRRERSVDNPRDPPSNTRAKKCSSAEPFNSSLSSNSSSSRKKSKFAFWTNLSFWPKPTAQPVKVPNGSNGSGSFPRPPGEDNPDQDLGSSYESVNSIATTTSFAFVSPKKLPKGRRIPLDDEGGSRTLPGHQRSQAGGGGALPRQGLKKKYGLQSCESLEHVESRGGTLQRRRARLNANYDLPSTSGGFSSDTGTLTETNTARRKRRAPPLPPAVPEVSTKVSEESTPQKTSKQESPKASLVPLTEPKASPELLRPFPHPIPVASSSASSNNVELLKVTSLSAEAGPSAKLTRVPSKRESYPGVLLQQRKGRLNCACSTSIFASHSRRAKFPCGSDHCVHRKVVHVKGKKKAPPPPNPFGDPDTSQQNPVEKRKLPRNPFYEDPDESTPPNISQRQEAQSSNSPGENTTAKELSASQSSPNEAGKTGSSEQVSTPSSAGSSLGNLPDANSSPSTERNESFAGTHSLPESSNSAVVTLGEVQSPPMGGHKSESNEQVTTIPASSVLKSGQSGSERISTSTSSSKTTSTSVASSSSGVIYATIAIATVPSTVISTPPSVMTSVPVTVSFTSRTSTANIATPTATSSPQKVSNSSRVPLTSVTSSSSASSSTKVLGSTSTASPVKSSPSSIFTFISATPGISTAQEITTAATVSTAPVGVSPVVATASTTTTSSSIAQCAPAVSTYSTHPPPEPQSPPPATILSPEALALAEEIAQNLLNDEQERQLLQESSTSASSPSSKTKSPRGSLFNFSRTPKRSSCGPSNTGDLESLLHSSQTLRAQVTAVDQQVRARLVEESPPISPEGRAHKDKSPMFFFSTKSSRKSLPPSTIEEVPGGSSSSASTPPPSSNGGESLSSPKVTLRPWYKRLSGGGNSGGALRPKPSVILLPKFSDLDKEATRIVEENKRRSAELAFNANARTLIDIFNETFEPLSPPPPSADSASERTVAEDPSQVQNTPDSQSLSGTCSNVPQGNTPPTVVSATPTTPSTVSFAARQTAASHLSYSSTRTSTTPTSSSGAIPKTSIATTSSVAASKASGKINEASGSSPASAVKSILTSLSAATSTTPATKAATSNSNAAPKFTVTSGSALSAAVTTPTTSTSISATSSSAGVLTSTGPPTSAGALRSSGTGHKVTSTGTPHSSEEPRSIAVVQPQAKQSLATSKPTSGTTSPPSTFVGSSLRQSTAVTTTPTSSSSVTVSSILSTTTTSLSSAKANTPLTSAGEDWSCPRCTLKNTYWRALCEACYFRRDSGNSSTSGSSMSSILQQVNSKTSPPASIPSSTSSPTSASHPPTPSVTTSTNKPTQAVKPKSSSAPACENFLSQLPSKDIPGKNDVHKNKLLQNSSAGVRLVEDPEVEELSLERLRRARLAFFQKDQQQKASQLASSPSERKCPNNPPGQSPSNKKNNLTTPSTSSPPSCLPKHSVNVFDDGEDSFLDNFTRLASPPSFLGNIPPSLPGPSSSPSPGGWRPLLAPITEADANLYCLSEWDRIYENWELPSDNESPRRPATAAGSLPTLDSHNPNFLASVRTTNTLSEDDESVLEMERTRKHRTQNTHNKSTGSGGGMGVSDLFAVEENERGVAVLLRKLEWAIGNGEHRLAASLAHDLALLKVKVAALGPATPTDPITIRVYVEDRFMQQGPFLVQVWESMTVSELKAKIESDWGIPVHFQKWILGQQMAEGDTTPLASFRLKNNSLAFLYLVTPNIHQTPPNVPPPPVPVKAPQVLASSLPKANNKAGGTVPAQPKAIQNGHGGTSEVPPPPSGTKSPIKLTQSNNIAASGPVKTPPSTGNPSNVAATSQSTKNPVVANGHGSSVVIKPDTQVGLKSSQKVQENSGILSEANKKQLDSTSPIQNGSKIESERKESGVIAKDLKTSPVKPQDAAPQTPTVLPNSVTNVKLSPKVLPRSKIGDKTESISPVGSIAPSAAPTAQTQPPKQNNATQQPLPPTATTPKQVVTLEGQSSPSKANLANSQVNASGGIIPAVPAQESVAIIPTVVLKKDDVPRERSDESKEQKSSGVPETPGSSKEVSGAGRGRTNLLQQKLAHLRQAAEQAFGKSFGTPPQSPPSKTASNSKANGATSSSAETKATPIPKENDPRPKPRVKKVVKQPKYTLSIFQKEESSSSGGEESSSRSNVRGKVKIQNPVDGFCQTTLEFKKPATTGVASVSRKELTISPEPSSSSSPAISEARGFTPAELEDIRMHIPSPVEQFESKPNSPEPSASSNRITSPAASVTKSSSSTEAKTETSPSASQVIPSDPKPLVTSSPFPTEQPKSPVPVEQIAVNLTSRVNVEGHSAHEMPSPDVQVPVVLHDPNPSSDSTTITLPSSSAEGSTTPVGSPSSSTQPTQVMQATLPSSSQMIKSHLPPVILRATKPPPGPVAPPSSSALPGRPHFLSHRRVSQIEIPPQFKQASAAPTNKALLPTFPSYPGSKTSFNQSPKPFSAKEPENKFLLQRKNSDSSIANLVLESHEDLSSLGAAALPPPSQHQEKKESNVDTYMRMLEDLEKLDLIPCAEAFDCPVCFLSLGPGEGVTLRDCLHNFCRECLVGAVKYADISTVGCPFRDDSYSCTSSLQEREIKALVPPDVFEAYLARSVKLAERVMTNTFHCRTSDCPGWCIFEDDVNSFFCPVCKKRNCLTCQAIHEDMDCRQYQRQLAIAAETDQDAKSSRLMLEKMIERGEALDCPACHVVLLKKWGCDWVRCSYCKTEICWVTKGFRWGSGGKGDTSGGCKCGVNGVRCHPKCTYCH